jgi:signal transduction histidine kinase
VTMPLVTGAAVAALGVLLGLDQLDALELGWRWGAALTCVVAGCALHAVATSSASSAFVGVLDWISKRNGWRLPLLRAGVLLTAPLAGLGVAAYAVAAMREILDTPRPPPPPLDWRRVAGTGLIGIGFVSGATEAGYQLGSDDLLWSVLLAGSGLSLFWWLPDSRTRKQSDQSRFDAEALFWLSLGLIATAIGLALGSTGLFDQAGSKIAATAAAIALIALVIGPRWLRTSRALEAERVERARATERAEVGGILHDSVMQTLALIQDRADDPVEVAALARRQERELRTWLLGNRPTDGPPRSVATSLRAVAAQVEDAYRVKIEVVTVGDAPLDEQIAPLIAAAGEALVNAAKHADGAPISLFGEIEERRVAAYVRDRGPGFDLDAIPADRHGVRDSIFARMNRHGGQAAVRTAPGGGCEVKLVQERRR